jgi:hypothetical protein
MLYISDAIPRNNTSITITGRGIARSDHSKPARAFLAADLHLGHVVLTAPTIVQSALLAGVSRNCVHQALNVSDPKTRKRVITGELSLWAAAKPANDETLAAHLARSSPEEWVEAARAIGVARIWDEMLEPAI